MRCTSAGDLSDHHLGVVLTMSVLALVTLAATELKDDDLLATAVGLDLGDHFRARDIGGTDLGSLAVADEKDLVERDGGADIGVELLNTKLATSGDAVLLAAGSNDRVGCLVGHDVSAYR